ncbi:MAG: hypothetical protein F6K48_10470 [Okeania sp. SIO3H1]|nr:hypothetical protein [Okeania sp. SIO3H1]
MTKSEVRSQPTPNPSQEGRGNRGFELRSKNIAPVKARLRDPCDFDQKSNQPSHINYQFFPSWEGEGRGVGSLLPTP